MIKQVTYVLMLSLALVGMSAAQTLPAYYEEDRFDDVGRIDRISFEDNKVVINDMLYVLSDAVVVHSLSSENDSLRRLRVGSFVAFKITAGPGIKELWLLPDNYKLRPPR